MFKRRAQVWNFCWLNVCCDVEDIWCTYLGELSELAAVHSHITLQLCKWSILIWVVCSGGYKRTELGRPFRVNHRCQNGSSVHCCGPAGCAVWWAVWGESLPAACWYSLQHQGAQSHADCEQRREVWKLDLAWDVPWQLLCCWFQSQGKDTSQTHTHTFTLNNKTTNVSLLLVCLKRNLSLFPVERLENENESHFRPTWEFKFWPNNQRTTSWLDWTGSGVVLGTVFCFCRWSLTSLDWMTPPWMGSAWSAPRTTAETSSTLLNLILASKLATVLPLYYIFYEWQINFTP